MRRVVEQHFFKLRYALVNMVIMFRQIEIRSLVRAVTFAEAKQRPPVWVFAERRHVSQYHEQLFTSGDCYVEALGFE